MRTSFLLVALAITIIFAVAVFFYLQDEAGSRRGDRAAFCVVLQNNPEIIDLEEVPDVDPSIYDELERFAPDDIYDSANDLRKGFGEVREDGDHLERLFLARFDPAVEDARRELGKYYRGTGEYEGSGCSAVSGVTFSTDVASPAETPAAVVTSAIADAADDGAAEANSVPAGATPDSAEE